jgi:hypothetical protein
LNYSKRFGRDLDTGDASSLLALSIRNKHHAQTALANLAKFKGVYTDWLHIRQKYGLKWSKGDDSIQTFERFFNDDLNFDTMLQQVKQMIRLVPMDIGNIIKFGCLVGLRSSEIVESVKLINDVDKFSTYWNPDRSVLQHYKFPSIFLRQTKKWFISLVSPDIVDIAKAVGTSNITYNQIRLVCHKRKIKCDCVFVERYMLRTYVKAAFLLKLLIVFKVEHLPTYS